MNILRLKLAHEQTCGKQSNNITVVMKTSNGMSEPNPFRLERDNKKFFLELAKAGTQLAYEQAASSLVLSKSTGRSGQSRIKNLNREIEQLARRKEEMLFKDSQLDYIFKNQRPSIKVSDFVEVKEKKFRIRAILKQKKQTLHEFLDKKKEIFLSKMSINIKRQQTSKLEDYIRDQKTTLRARQLYFKNDVEFMNRFISDIKSEADKAEAEAEAELKTQESLAAQLTFLETEIERKENLISKAKDDFETLQSYKKFLDKFLHFSNSTWKPYRQHLHKDNTMFITQGKHKIAQEQKPSQVLIKFSPQNLLDVFNQIEENNIGEIQNRQLTQAELEKVRVTERQMIDVTAKTEQQYSQRFRVLEKSVEQHSKTNQRLKEMKKNHRNKIKITDNEDLDLDKIGAKIVDIYKDINAKFKPQDSNGPDSKELKKCMTEIEQQIVKLREQIDREKQINPSRNEEIQKQIKQTYKKQNLLRKQQQAKELEFKKEAQQSKKKNEAILQIQRGRRDMTKVLHQKKPAKKKVEVVDDSNKDDKYFKADNESETQER